MEGRNIAGTTWLWCKLVMTASPSFLDFMIGPSLVFSCPINKITFNSENVEHKMAWGAPGSGPGVDDWVRRLIDDDPSLTSITVFRTRKFGHEVRDSFN